MREWVLLLCSLWCDTIRCTITRVPGRKVGICDVIDLEHASLDTQYQGCNNARTVVLQLSCASFVENRGHSLL